MESNTSCSGTQYFLIWKMENTVTSGVILCNEGFKEQYLIYKRKRERGRINYHSIIKQFVTIE